MCPAGGKARQWARRARDKKSVVARAAKRNSLKLNEQTGNVYENKGSLWKTLDLGICKGRFASRSYSLPLSRLSSRSQETSDSKTERTGNLYENKGALWKSHGKSRNLFETNEVIRYFPESR
jgi:hypothetical protein